MIYTVATLARYVLVEANSEDEARLLARPRLRELDVETLERLECEVEIPIRTVRPATLDEIEHWTWHHEMLENERRTNDLDR